MSAHQDEKLAAESAAERDIRLQQMSAHIFLTCIVRTSQWMRGRLAVEITEERDVTEQDTGNNRLLSHSSLCFNSVPSKSRCINLMRIWLHWICQLHYLLREIAWPLASQSPLNVCVVVAYSNYSSTNNMNPGPIPPQL